MNIPELGTLEEVDLRQAWNHEAHIFIPWLARNLHALSDVIGIPMELEGREVAVDTFSADILARNPQDDSLILIENQLEVTDHNHLGQIMTYLAGLETNTVIWVAADFREAHLSAVRWLNDHTVEPFAFFAVKVRVVRIGDSAPAPIFEVLVRPNQWERNLQAVAQETRSLSELGQFRKAFWSHHLSRYPDDSQDGPAGGVSNRWRNIDTLDVVISYYIARNSVGLFVRGRSGARSEDVYDFLEPHAQRLAERIRAEIGAPDGVYFFAREHKTDTSDRSQWDELSDWLHDQLDLYTSALKDLGSHHDT